MASDWPLLTGGRYSEVVVRTGFTVLIKIEIGSLKWRSLNTGGR
jgi:hypothetical protein